MKNILKILIIGISLISCSKDEIASEKSNSCYLLDYEKSSVLGSSEVSYKHKLSYSGNKITSRINYDNVSPNVGLYILGEISRDSLVYDNLGRISKIYKIPLYDNYTYSEFIYENSNSLPHKRNEISIFNYTNSTYTFIYPEDIYYDNKNRIIRTVIDYNEPNYEFDITTIYEYDNNGNLTKIDSKKVQYGNTFQTISEYSDYDNKLNPFSNFPFIDFRGISVSTNNFRHYQTTKYTNENITGISDGTYSYEYNEYNYPLIGIYECK
ncbi:MAG TPA: hypothetical protein VIN72_05480 [Lutibacter sp.]